MMDFVNYFILFIYLFIYFLLLLSYGRIILSSSMAASQIPHLRALPIYVHNVNATENNSSWATMSLNFLQCTEYRDDSGPPLNAFNPLNAELNPICHLLTLLGAHHFLHVNRVRVKSLTLRLLMSYIYIWSTYS